MDSKIPENFIPKLQFPLKPQGQSQGPFTQDFSQLPGAFSLKPQGQSQGAFTQDFSQLPGAFSLKPQGQSQGPFTQDFSQLPGAFSLKPQGQSQGPFTQDFSQLQRAFSSNEYESQAKAIKHIIRKLDKFERRFNEKLAKQKKKLKKAFKMMVGSMKKEKDTDELFNEVNIKQESD